MIPDVLFISKVKRLGSNFGSNTETTTFLDRCRLLYSKFSWVDERLLDKAIDYMLRNLDRFPTVKVFQECLNVVDNEKKFYENKHFSNEIIPGREEQKKRMKLLKDILPSVVLHNNMFVAKFNKEKVEELEECIDKYSNPVPF